MPALYWIFTIFLFGSAQATTDVYGCVDLALNCQQLQAQYFCTNQVYLSVMADNCKRTCGYCNPGNIFQYPQQPTGPFNPPNTLNPYPNPYYQNPNPYYQNPNPQPVNQNCVDKSNNCFNWAKNGFCTNAFYDPSVKQDYCAATCRMC